VFWLCLKKLIIFNLNIFAEIILEAIVKDFVIETSGSPCLLCAIRNNIASNFVSFSLLFKYSIFFRFSSLFNKYSLFEFFNSSFNNKISSSLFFLDKFFSGFSSSLLF
jgi:hypothetical protein